MSMSDCERCWSTPCECGWKYRSWTPERIQELIETLEHVKEFKEKNPDFKFDYRDSIRDPHVWPFIKHLRVLDEKRMEKKGE